MPKYDPMTRARAAMLGSHPFFAALALRLKLVEADWLGTAAVDGRHIFYNRKWIDSLSDEEVQAIVAHETMHCALSTMGRRGSRDPDKWNVATDHVINLLLEGARFSLPTPRYCDSQYADLPAETVYTMLPDMPRCGIAVAGRPGLSSDPGECGGVMDAPGTSADSQTLAAEWRVAMVQAAQSARNQGNLPGSLEALVQDIVTPALDWKKLLRDFVCRSARNDYNWFPPSRRYMGTGFYLPSLRSDELPDIVIAVDTSGSISTKELAMFSAELSSILGDFETTIHLIHCDAEIAKTALLTRADLPLDLSWKGRGGTDFRPVFEWVTDQGVTPTCLIYFTDLYGPAPDVEPDYPVLWVSTTQEKWPWGEGVLLDSDVD